MVCKLGTMIRIPKFNIAFEKWWLEGLVSFCEGLFSGAMLNFREGIHGILEVEMARFRGGLKRQSIEEFISWLDDCWSISFPEMHPSVAATKCERLCQ